MTERRQQINVGGPRSDTVHRGQRGMRLLGRDVGQRCERKLAAGDGARDFLQRLDFRRREADPGELGRARADDRSRCERIERCGKPSSDRAGARGRKLLRYHRRRESGKAIGPSPQRRPSRLGDERVKSRIGRAKCGKRRFEIGFGADMGRHVTVACLA